MIAALHALVVYYSCAVQVHDITEEIRAGVGRLMFENKLWLLLGSYHSGLR